ncbi:hypothetical protein [Mycobacteroides abscessus]|uniref:Uncharacterized protein n=1 Tax=Mycobacteroides abscessus TaxID=36809 RepID=A0A0U0ZJD0_9MYCO|nr:hypothetical protein [Mycobacteroides abscessus]SKS10317.1 Uncharacterised protein [Mycobacteroides abscessus subsp. abscessus]MBL3733212.1 hypothetical protein [Mycobacteroides abscessus subsp. massiliense]MBL3761535.1 hypothetical protein [Mycobacteroides abscessus subsp. massiliense]MBN7478967.1 hypothetical protein [Mycobacteroides abscessus subsp. massiliense]MDM2103181.1 hypothetical protein [Mycobacteroides abscessus]
MTTTISTSVRTTEARVRRAAKRAGLALEKSRTRNPAASDYGTYGLVRVTNSSGHWRSRELVAGDSHTGYGLSLGEAADWIEELRLREIAMKLDPSGHLYREGQRMTAAILAMEEDLEPLVDEDFIVQAFGSENQVLIWLDATFKDSIPALDPVHDLVKKHGMTLVEKTTVPMLGHMSLHSVVYWYKAPHLVGAS